MVCRASAAYAAYAKSVVYVPRVPCAVCMPCAVQVCAMHTRHLEVLPLERHRWRRPLLFERPAPRPERGVLRERVPPVLERGGEASVRLRLVGLLLHAWHDGEARPPHGPKTTCWRAGEGRACRQPRPQQQTSRGRAQAGQMHGGALNRRAREHARGGSGIRFSRETFARENPNRILSLLRNTLFS